MLVKFSGLLLLSALSGFVTAEETANIEIIAFNCFTCHGEEGRSQGATPSLQGLPGKYVQQAMNDYKADLRPGTIMPRIAKAYNATEIQALADYFAQLKQPQ